MPEATNTSNSSHACDVLVVGAGPAGSSCAYELARAGMHVIVIDKATFPRNKTCGDGLTTATLRHLEYMGVDPRVLPSWRVVHDTFWRSPSGHMISLPVPQDGIRIGVARRYELDELIMRAAQHAGAEILEENSIISCEMISGDTVRVRTSQDLMIDASYVIGADGMWSPLRKLVEAASRRESTHAPAHERYLGDIHAFRQYVTNVTGPARDALFVSFDEDILPGYFWSFPVGNGRANIGFGILRNENRPVAWMKSTWTDLLNRTHIREMLGPAFQPEGPHQAWPIPAHIDISALTALSGRVLFVGDAGRMVDPLTGEGIGQALETGASAAHAIVRAGIARPHEAARRYRNSIRYGLRIDNAFARWIAQLISHPLGARFAIRFAPLGLRRGKYAVSWAFEDNPRAALLTPWRWQKRFTKKSGAFFS